MNVQRGDIVIVDYPYSNTTPEAKYVRLLLYNQISGIRGLRLQLSQASQVVIAGESEQPPSILLILRLQMGNKQAFVLIPLLNVKICSPTIKTGFCVSSEGFLIQQWNK